MAILLAGDVGRTKTLVGLFDSTTRPPAPIQVARFATLNRTSLVDIVDTFLAGRPDRISAACFGVAGTVHGQTANLTHVPWRIESAAIAARCDIPTVRLVNDVTAMAYAVPTLGDTQLEFLQRGDRPAGGNAALIAPGTGLGEAFLHSIEGRVVPAPSEGGHGDFAARTARELDFVKELAARCGRVSCEMVLSGPGLVRLHSFLHRPGTCAAMPLGMPSAEQPARIAGAGMGGECGHCVEAIDMFVSALGAEAANLGLRAIATAGVYLGGGIPRQILPALRKPAFLEAFRSKAPMESLVEAMAVAVILTADTALVGAAVAADQLRTVETHP